MKKVIITIILFIGFVVLFFGLTWGEYQELEENMEISEVVKEDVSNKINYSLGVEEVVSSLEEDYVLEDRKLAGGLPDDHYAPSLLSSIEEIAQNSGLRIEHFGGFTVHEYPEMPQFNRIELEFQLRGGYNSFKYFIANLENFSRIISLEQLRMEKVSTEGGETLHYFLVLDTFSY